MKWGAERGGGGVAWHREKLKVDLKNKKHALELDMTCLHLEAEHASHHPSHEETLHTKVSRASRRHTHTHTSRLVEAITHAHRD